MQKECIVFSDFDQKQTLLSFRFCVLSKREREKKGVAKRMKLKRQRFRVCESEKEDPSCRNECVHPRHYPFASRYSVFIICIELVYH